MRPRSRVGGRPAAGRIRGRYMPERGRTVADRSPGAPRHMPCGLARRGGAGRPPDDRAELGRIGIAGRSPSKILRESSAVGVGPLRPSTLLDDVGGPAVAGLLAPEASRHAWSKARVFVVFPWASFLAVVLLGSSARILLWALHSEFRLVEPIHARTRTTNDLITLVPENRQMVNSVA